MVKKISTLIYITLLTLGVVFTPVSAKAEASNESIACNRTEFSIVSNDKAPEVLNEEINFYKGSEGFLYYIDNNSGDLYVAVLIGEKPTPSYSVKVNYVDDVEGRACISVDETYPDEYTILPQVVTYPYTIIKAELPAYKICVKNSFGKVYNYLGGNEAVPIIGVSGTIGSLQNIYTDNDYIFLEILDSNRESRLFYVSNSDEWKNKIGNLKLNTAVSVRFALGTPKKYNGIYAFPLSEINTPVDKDSLTNNNWENLSSYSNVLPDKKWTIPFNQDLKGYTVKSSDIYITDSEGNIIPTVLTLSEDNRSITLLPYKNYRLGDKYWLFITNDLYNKSPSLKGYRMKFQITESVDVKHQ